MLNLHFAIDGDLQVFFGCLENISGVVQMPWMRACVVKGRRDDDLSTVFVDDDVEVKFCCKMWIRSFNEEHSSCRDVLEELSAEARHSVFSSVCLGVRLLRTGDSRLLSWTVNMCVLCVLKQVDKDVPISFGFLSRNSGDGWACFYERPRLVIFIAGGATIPYGALLGRMFPLLAQSQSAVQDSRKATLALYMGWTNDA